MSIEQNRPHSEFLSENRLRVLVAGATGQLGRHVVRELRERNVWVRGITRQARRNAESLGANDIVSCDLATGEGLSAAFAGGIDVVFSALGNSVRPVLTDEKESFADVDYKLNKFLLDRARGSGVRRFVYVSVFPAAGCRGTAYVQAHEAVASAIIESGLEYGILRPTGFYSALTAYLEFAGKGQIPLVGNGDARTNPIDERDVAELAAEMILASDAAQEIAAGGPEILTRREMGAIAFAAMDKPERFLSLPESFAVNMPIARLVRLFDRRMAELIEFYTRVQCGDAIAPVRGQRTLGDYFAGAAPAFQNPLSRERIEWQTPQPKEWNQPLPPSNKL